MLGAVGQDRIGKTQIELLQREGVSTEAVAKLKDTESGHAYIFVDRAGQNVIASSLAANTSLGPQHIKSTTLGRVLDGCRCVAVTDPPMAIAEMLISVAHQRQIPVIWDPGVLASCGWDTLAPLAARTHTLILNETEAQLMFDTQEPERIARGFDLRGEPSYVVLKQGARGSTLIECSTARTMHFPALPLQSMGLHTVNTVGCGDVFVGAYAAGLAQGLEQSHALLEASAAAGLNATRAETRGGPNHDELVGVIRSAARFGFALDQTWGSTN
jgi:ribokinase